MNFISEPWHWFVLGIALMLIELFLPSFAALWFGLAVVNINDEWHIRIESRKRYICLGVELNLK